MKRAVFAVMLLAFCLGRARAATPTQARQKYDAKDYRGAAELYQELSAADPRNAGLHYNLGNALFRQGQIGRAIASYQRAFEIDPRDADIRHNLDFALKRSGEELTPAGTPAALFVLVHCLSLRELAGLQWLGCWAALLLSSLWLISPGRRSRTGPWLALVCLFWALFASWWLARGGLKPAKLGVIVSPTAEIRSGPGESSSVSFTAPEGRRVQILSENGPWLEVGDLKEGSKGWLRAEDIERI